MTSAFPTGALNRKPCLEVCSFDGVCSIKSEPQGIPNRFIDVGRSISRHTLEAIWKVWSVIAAYSDQPRSRCPNGGLSRKVHEIHPQVQPNVSNNIIDFLKCHTFETIFIKKTYLFKAPSDIRLDINIRTLISPNLQAPSPIF